MVAQTLRNRILSGDLKDRAELPKQDELFTEFGVSMPSIREALRILETEGLVTVRRGARGGAVVHHPDPGTAGYILSLMMQAQAVDVADLALAVRQMEPLCAGMCAGRADRAEAVLPALRTVQADAADAFDDFPKFVAMMRLFHETVLQTCGNGTMTLLIGVLEGIWYTQEAAWATRVYGEVEPPEAKVRYQTLREHDVLIDAIERGDVDGATRLARNHLHEAQRYALLDDATTERRLVDARLQRPLPGGAPPPRPARPAPPARDAV
ncbi:MAG TPA: FCD domain-containing protein [Acidimicrobiales bacterium]|jgi:DNA-binding FadR family transcriptional regulator|nr:FCD domain-containing protein [Acidimicrobiales bacterium]